MTVMALTGITSLTGLNWATLVGSAQGKKHILRSAARRRILASLVLGCPVLLSTWWILRTWFPEQSPASRACLLLLPVFPFMYSFTGVYHYLNGLGQFWCVACAQIVAAFLNLLAVSVCLLVHPSSSLLPPVAALLVKTLFESSLYLALVRRDQIPLLDQDAHLLSFGTKATLTGTTGNFDTYADRLVVGFIYGFNPLGLYSGGRSVVVALRQIPLIYYQLYTPKLARRRPADAWRLTNRALVWGLLLFVPIYALVYWALPWLYSTFLGKFDQSASYARWFVLMSFVGIPYYFYCPFFHSQRQARREAIVRVTRTVLYVLGLLVFVRIYGLMGIIYAQIAATAIMSVHSWWEARKSRGLE